MWRSKRRGKTSEAGSATGTAACRGCDAFILDGVLTEEECEDLISQAEGLWTFWEPRLGCREPCGLGR